MDVALHGSVVLKEVLCLPPPHVEWARGLERLLKVFEACPSPTGLRYGSAVGHNHHLLPTVLLVHVPSVAVSLGQGRVTTAITFAR